MEHSVWKKTDEKKQTCKNCEGKGTLKKGAKIVRCRRCGGTGIKPYLLLTYFRFKPEETGTSEVPVH